ncbi:NAD(P)/FAD-dependent oxidoreductase [Streptomyces sp. NBC_01803]|uniref:NAD(P)/FAD-dependent oxidoreductase n=1 Tax=Streptomyces sp. NBC_01803 TaxID=2975946 RepID=UPI002DD8311F|nr:NAD(P)/FAD-dependent oxidoreductase [Streptomyces sp. NBC_01803]WSA45035.1 NAD(P)/FAD-dependent oxidoreductase [Streptomyces sp. NBC_01803]
MADSHPDSHPEVPFYDLLFVGAGPTGLYGAYCAGFRGLRAAVLDSLPQPGGQIAALFPEKWIYDIAGLPRVRGRVLVDRLLEQAAAYDPAYLLGRQAVTLHDEPDGGLRIGCSDGTAVRCRALVITAGVGRFQPRPLPAAADWAGDGVHYFVPDPGAHRDQDVVVVGGGDSALDWCLALRPIARSVTLVHRRDTFRAHAATVVQLHADEALPLLLNSELTALRGGYDGGTLRAVEVRSVVDGTVTRLPAQAVVAALGFLADPGPLRTWVELRERRVVTDSRMRTSRPGVYAAGDIATYPGKVRLISVGFGEVATAVNNAAIALDPAQPLAPGHSSDRPQPPPRPHLQEIPA